MTANSLHVRHAASPLSRTGDIDAAKARLCRIPWCAKLLFQPGLTIERPRAYRDGERRGREDSLTATTLNVGDGVSEFLYFYHENAGGADESHEPAHSKGDAKDVVREISAIVVAGEGLNGFPDTLHGGILATLLDEIMGTWVNLNWARGVLTRTAWMTASLNTTFLKPVKTPITLLAVARLVKLDGRKLFLEARLEDGKDQVLAKADALFVGTRPRPRPRSRL
jgi:uncharacterized protein (TIGR00369 family)